MEDIGSWAWLIIAVFVVVTRVLPRLFRGKKSTETKMPPPQKPQAAKPVETSGGPVTDFDTLVSSLNRTRFAPQRGKEAPPPIEPK